MENKNDGVLNEEKLEKGRRGGREKT